MLNAVVLSVVAPLEMGQISYSACPLPALPA
jgi:hypothetical protein